MTKKKQFDVTEVAEENHWRTIKRLAHYLWPKGRWDLKIRVLGAMFSLVLGKVMVVVVPILLKFTIDALEVEPSVRTLPLLLILAYGGAKIGAQFFDQFRDYLFARVSQNAQRTIAHKTFQHLHHLSLDFHLNRQTGGLSRIIDRGTQGINFVLRFVLFRIVPILLEVALVTGILLYHFDLFFAFIPLVAVTVFVIYTFKITEWGLKFRKTMNKNDYEANTKAVDSLLNYETVKYFGNEKHEFERYDRALARYETAAVQNQLSLSTLNFGQGSIIALGLIAAMIMAGKGVVAGTLTMGDFVMIHAYLIQLFSPLNFLGFIYRQTKQSLVDMDKMFELMEVEKDVRDTDRARPLKLEEREGAQGEIKFDGVYFSYKEDRTILKDITFTIPAGSSLAIVGPTGAGKSTISRLLFRFYDVDKGRITIDGQDLREITQDSLRARIGIVPQDTVLFNDTIGYNINYGSIDAGEKEVTEAAKMAQIHDFVTSLPEKYDTLVGERGLKLSGGEKQRVAIARTILKNPPILIFDEATSALDSHTEKEIQASLDQVSQNHTTVIIAHRLSTVVGADKIIVLKEGQVVEEGSHRELLEKGGEYASMWDRQQEEEPDSEGSVDFD